jgi:hypothetical protein
MTIAAGNLNNAPLIIPFKQIWCHQGAAAQYRNQSACHTLNNLKIS